MDGSTPLVRAAAAGGGSTEDKRALLKTLVRSRAAAALPALSEAQSRLWDLEAHEGAPGIHDFSLAYELRGPLDPDLLEQALQAVAARHASLRSRIEVQGGAVRFVERLPDPVLERRPVGEDLAAALLAEAALPLDPTVAGWRAVLFRGHGEDHTLLLHFHHIFADRWSVAVLIGDLAAAYTAIRDGVPYDRSPLPPAPSEPAPTPEDLAYWSAVFSPPAEVLRLPFDRPGGGFAGYAGARLAIEIDGPATQALKSVAGTQSVTLFPALLAAFAGFLHAHTGQEDLTICTPMTGRHRAGTRSAIGYFNNILPLRLDLRGNPPFEALLGRVAARGREVAGHQDVPFHRIAALPELTQGRIARCLFTLQNIPGLDLHLPGIAASYRDVPNGTANFDLALFAEEKDGRLRCFLDYKTALLEPDAAQLLADRLVEFVRAAVDHPSAQLSELPRYASAPQAAAAPVPARRSRPAKNLLEEKMTGLWRELFSDSTGIDAETDFFAMGGDSIKAARLFAIVRREFQVDMPLAALLEGPTPRELVRRIADRDWAAPWLSLVPIQPAGSRPPLFCVHGAGGNVISFRFLGGCLHDRPVYGLQAQGLKPGERPLETVEAMAEHYLQAVRAIRPHGPYLLLGYSVGASVAYEMAQRLHADREEVRFLGMVDHAGPKIQYSRLDWIRLHLMNLSMLPPAERWMYVRRGVVWRCRILAAAWRVHKSPAAPERLSGSSTVDLLEQSLRAFRNYQVRPYAGKVTLFRARQGSPKIRADVCGGWGGVAQSVEIREVPGDHTTMIEPPHTQALGAAIAQCLDEVSAR